MELTQLHYFLKVAEHGNFTHAANELGVSQPALSRAIGKLEEQLGRPLFERQPRSVALTDAGRMFESRVRQVFELLEDAKAEMNDDGESGRLRVAAIPTIAPYFLPKLLSEFANSHPQAHVSVTEDVTEQTIKRVSRGEVDIAIVALPVTAQYLDTQSLFEEELLLVLPKGHPLVEKPEITLADVEPLPFVLLNEAHCLSDNITSFCRQRSFQPVAVERTSQLAMVQELVTLDHGVSMVPAMARAVDQSDQRVYRSLSGAKPTREIAMLWNPYRFQSKLLESFKKQALALAGEILTRGEAAVR